MEKHPAIRICLIIAVAGSMTGCSSGLFKPVQPWQKPGYADQFATPIAEPGNQDEIANSLGSNTSQGSSGKSSAGTDADAIVAQPPADLSFARRSATSAPQPAATSRPPTSINPANGSATRQQPAQPLTLNAVAAEPTDPIYRQQPSASRNVAPASRSSLLKQQYFAPPGYAEQILQNGLPQREPLVQEFSLPPGAAAKPQTSPAARGPAQLPAFESDNRNSAPAAPRSTTFYRSQSPQDSVLIPSDGSQGSVSRTAAQIPDLSGGLQGTPTFQQPNIGGSPLITGGPGSVPQQLPADFADLDVFLSETSTGRINFGGAFNSDSGLVGQFVIEERNFDITRFPRSFRDLGTAWRGAGQNFRLELVPGSDVERYLVNFSEPFLFGSRVSFSSSLFYFQRQFFDYDEERLGGRLSLGYRISPDVSVSAGLRLENVEISDPRVDTSPQLNDILGDTDLFVANVGLIRDTRDHPFLPTEGNYTALTFSQGFGEFDYSRADIDFRTYKLIYQRPDSSGRHTLSYSTKLGFSGSQTPLFENYFAGGFSTIRGFDFRGASPLEGDVRVGGEFQWLNSIEYTFPLTADDMVKGVLFTDFGTVEEDIAINGENFRVAPGFGFRVHLPAAGIGAPLAFDFAFPVSDAEGDERETFSFYLGVSR